ncbi:hypothetical protein AAG570_014007 [Ranatra chinensis]|uniref:Enoyl reductase (ER) domain-containing protein n=1 Tax=Ranatra chinensis TaxID=642074 RepID=A0ABD0XS48_9HEMI
MKITAAVTTAPCADFVFKELTLSDPNPNEVLVRVVATGVCHTDAGARDSQFPTNYPIVLGHEAAGIVEETGVGVTSVQKGDHVILSYCYCGNCPSCLTGNPGGCKENGRLNFGGKMEDGAFRLHDNGQPVHSFFGQSSFATYAVANEKNVVKVDKDIDLALLGPLGCGILTGCATVLNGIKPDFASSIVILGCGAVGLSAVMGAKLSMCDTIIAVDINDERLALAKELGATHTINGKHGDVTAAILEATNGLGANYGVDTTGNKHVLLQGLKGIAPAGKLVVVAVGYGDVTIDIAGDILFPTRTIQGMIEGAVMPKEFIPKLISYYKKGLFPFDKLICFYDFKDINQAFADTKSGKSIKAVLRINA